MVERSLNRGRRRGRPVVLTAEQRKKNQQRGWRRRKARQRKQEADNEWLRATNKGYIEQCSVIHWDQFVSFLIHAGLLDEIDAETPARIHEATDALLERHVEKWASVWQGCQHYWKHTIFDDVNPHPEFRGLPTGSGTVSIRVSMALVEALGLELECGNRSKIRTAIESLLFCCYSNLADRQIPNPWPTTGTQRTRPIYSRTQTHTAKYLRSIGALDAAQGTQYRQDVWLDPKDHENRKPVRCSMGTEWWRVVGSPPRTATWSTTAALRMIKIVPH